MNLISSGVFDRWDSRTTFVLALSASSVGLGNLWRLSYLSGEYGGGAFVITYVLCLFFLAVPVMVAEVVLGSYGGPDTMAAMAHASASSRLSRGWKWVGALACLTGLLILSLYVVIAGWSLAYFGFMQEGTFSALRAVEVGAHFELFLSQPMHQIYWQSLFLLVAAGVVVLGVQRGLAVLVWFAVPLMLAMLAFLVKFAFDNGNLEATQGYLFSTTMMDFTPRSALVALGHAFFTLGVGVGTGIAYGAYAPQRTPIARSVVAVAVFDTVIAILAGLAIYSIVFANNMAPAGGPGLLFVSLPYAFGNLMEGELAGTVFFALMVLTALGSAVAILEPIVATLKRELGFQRFTVTLLVGTVVWFLALAIVESLEAEPQYEWLGKQNLLGLLDTFTSTILLPLVALLITLFVGWCMQPKILRQALTRESDLFYSLWRILLRYIAPPAIIWLMLSPVYWP